MDVFNLDWICVPSICVSVLSYTLTNDLGGAFDVIFT